jgi:hypothetical protein
VDPNEDIGPVSDLAENQCKVLLLIALVHIMAKPEYAVGGGNAGASGAPNERLAHIDGCGASRNHGQLDRCWLNAQDCATVVHTLFELALLLQRERSTRLGREVCEVYGEDWGGRRMAVPYVAEEAYEFGRWHVRIDGPVARIEVVQNARRNVGNDLEREMRGGAAIDIGA